MTRRIRHIAVLLTAGVLTLAASAIRAEKDDADKPAESQPSFDLSGDAESGGEKTAGVREQVYDDLKVAQKDGGHVYRRLIESKPEGDGRRLRFVIAKVFDQNYGRGHFDEVQSGAWINAEGKKDGLEVIHLDPGWRQVQWKDGVRQGVEKVYARAPEVGEYLEAEIPWKGGEVHGEKKTYYPSGKVRSVTRYVKGEPHGDSVTCAENEKVIRRTTFRKGERQGEMIDFWASSGKRRRVVPYKDGKVHGTVREFHENGKLKREIPFKDNAMHGVEKQFDKDGKLERTRYWIQGELVTEGVFKKEYKP